MSKGRKTRRRWLAWTVIGLAVLFAGGYRYLTDPVRLRAKALEALGAWHIEGVEIGEVAFSPWGGILLTDLVFDPPNDNALYHHTAGVESGPLLRIGAANVRCKLLPLLLGRVMPSDIELRDVAVTAILSAGPGAVEPTIEESDAETRLLRELLGTPPTELPRVTITQADVQLLVAEREHVQLQKRWLVRAVGGATDAGYELRVDRRPADAQPLLALRWPATTQEIELALDWADLRTAERLAPSGVADSLQSLGLDGRVRVERLALGLKAAAPDSGGATSFPLRLAAAEIRLADVRCAIPVEEATPRASLLGRSERGEDHFLRFTDATAAASYRRGDGPGPGEVSLHVQGRLRDAPATFSFTTTSDVVRRLCLPDSVPAAGTHGPPLDLHDIRAAELEVVGLELPTLETYPAFVRSPRLGGPVVAALADYRPHGKVDVQLRLRPVGAPGVDGAPVTDETRLDGFIEAHGAACRYAHFPYPFENVRGRLRLVDGHIRLDHMTAQHGSGRIEADGVINESRHWSGFELTFHGQSITLDGDLYEALPDEHKQLWQRAAPLGVCDLVARVRRPEGSAETGPLQPAVEVDAHLLSGSLALGTQRRLDHADGWLEVRGGSVELRDLHGYDGDTGVRLDGGARVVDGVMRTDLRVEITDLPVEHHAALALGPRAAMPQLSFSGHADAWGRVYGAEQGGDHGESFALHIKDGEVRGVDPTRTWTVTDGWARVHGPVRELLSFAARQGAAQLNVSGVLPSPEQGGQPLSLDLHATTPAIGDLYPQFVPPKWAKVADALGLAGAGDVAVHLRPDGGTAAAPQQQSAEITLQADRMKPEPLPLELTDVTADLRLAPGRFRVRKAQAQWGAASRLILQQANDGTWQAGDVEADFDLAANGLTFTPELAAALPKPLSRLIDRLALRGAFDLLLPSVRVSGGAQRSWRLEGRLPLHDAALRMGLDVAGLEGSVDGVCLVRPDGQVDVDAQLALQRGLVANRPLEAWTGQLVYHAGDRWARLENLRGRLCDGVIQGDLRIDPRTSDYELALDLYGVSAAQLLPPTKGKAERPRRGRLDGDLWLRGREGDVSNRQGGGHLRLAGASFIQTPVLASVFQQRAQSPLSDTVDEARIRFAWEGTSLRLERIDIRSRDLRLVGEGTWNLSTDSVRMTLWGARPERWPRLAVISDLLDTASQELVQYRVEGTLADPKVTAEPLRRLNEALRRLLGEE